MAVRSRRARKPSPLEPLEPRKMFAVISIRDFGATPNGGSDDTSAIQRAVESSSPGDTILFPAGTYDIGGKLKDLPDHRTYRGQDGATVRGRTSEGQVFTFRGDDIIVTGLTFDGGGIFIDRSNGFNQRVVIDDNIFRLNTSGEHGNGITFTSGLADSRITNNLFTNYTGSFGIYGYNYNKLTIANNEFINVNAGMHIDAFYNSGDLVVEQNFITGARGMGMEFQSRANNLLFQDNWFEHPNLTSNYNDNTSSMAFSLILDKSSSIEVRRNVVIAPERPDGVGCRIAFEAGGDNAVFEDNYVNGIDQVLAMNDGAGSGSVIARNNKVMNYRRGPWIAFPASNRTLQSYNNSPDVQLTWDIARGKPQRNQRFGDPIAPPPADDPTQGDPGSNPPDTTDDSGSDDPSKDPTDAPTEPTTPDAGPTVVVGPTPKPDPAPPVSPPVRPTPQPIVTAVVAPSNLSARAVGNNRVDLSWSDNSYNETSIAVERSDDGINWVQLAALGPNSTRYVNLNVPLGQTLYYRVSANGSDGSSAPSNVVSVTFGLHMPAFADNTSPPNRLGPPVSPTDPTYRPPILGLLNSRPVEPRRPTFSLMRL